MIDYRKIIKNREFRLKLIRCLSFIPDKIYLKMVYWIKTGRKLNLENPKLFSEKQNWLKLNNIHPEYTNLVDKVKVREYIREIIGKEYLIPILGVWDKFEDIDFEKLPDKFVLKCNHDSGSVKIIKDKKNINKKELKKFYDFRLKLNPFCLGREYPYKNIKPKIIAEKYMEQRFGTDIPDYKFYCFNGEPKLLLVIREMFKNKKNKFYDMNFNYLNIIDLLEPKNSFEKNEEVKPVQFEEMKRLAKVLSKNKKFVRVDFYLINEKIYFGELTFFDSGGFTILEPIEWEVKFGEMLNIK